MRFYRLIFPCLLMGIFVVSAPSQTTYSKEEERMELFMNNGWAYAVKYDSLQRIPPVIDSCKRFLARYPNSFLKPGVFAYMLKLTAMISTQKARILPLIDSVLAYDPIAVTRMDVGRLLIEREIDPHRGAAFLEEALPGLTSSDHQYETHLLLARVAMNDGEYAGAQRHLRAALSLGKKLVKKKTTGAWLSAFSSSKTIRLNVEFSRKWSAASAAIRCPSTAA